MSNTNETFEYFAFLGCMPQIDSNFVAPCDYNEAMQTPGAIQSRIQSVTGHQEWFIPMDQDMEALLNGREAASLRTMRCVIFVIAHMKNILREHKRFGVLVVQRAHYVMRRILEYAGMNTPPTSPTSSTPSSPSSPSSPPPPAAAAAQNIDSNDGCSSLNVLLKQCCRLYDECDNAEIQWYAQHPRIFQTCTRLHVHIIEIVRLLGEYQEQLRLGEKSNNLMQKQNDQKENTNIISVLSLLSDKDNDSVKENHNLSRKLPSTKPNNQVGAEKAGTIRPKLTSASTTTIFAAPNSSFNDTYTQTMDTIHVHPVTTQTKGSTTGQNQPVTAHVYVVENDACAWNQVYRQRLVELDTNAGLGTYHESSEWDVLFSDNENMDDKDTNGMEHSAVTETQQQYNKYKETITRYNTKLVDDLLNEHAKLLPQDKAFVQLLKEHLVESSVRETMQQISGAQVMVDKDSHNNNNNKPNRNTLLRTDVKGKSLGGGSGHKSRPEDMNSDDSDAADVRQMVLDYKKCVAVASRRSFACSTDMFALTTTSLLHNERKKHPKRRLKTHTTTTAATRPMKRATTQQFSETVMTLEPVSDIYLQACLQLGGQDVVTIAMDHGICNEHGNVYPIMHPSNKQMWNAKSLGNNTHKQNRLAHAHLPPMVLMEALKKPITELRRTRNIKFYRLIQDFYNVYREHWDSKHE